MTTFGKIPAYQGTEKLELGVSPDKRALTLTFGDFKAHVGGEGAKVPVASRLLNFVVPLEGDGKHVEIEFTVQGTQVLEEGATATLVCSVNGQTMTADFAPESDLSIERVLKFAADGPSECRLSILLLVGRDSGKADREGELGVMSVDAEILPRIGKQPS